MLLTENTVNTMKKMTTTRLGVIAIVFLVALSGIAQTPSKAKNDFASFWSEFKAAVAKDDKEAVAAMTKLPMYLANKEQSKTGFLKLYGGLFPKKVKTCFSSAKPVKDQDSYSVFCGHSIYVFARENGKWKFTDLGVDD